MVVGGAVRDHLLGHPSKDLDVEVYALDLEALQAALEQIGTVHAVGRAFGVLKVRVNDSDEDYDVALPRTENKVGRGHRGFVVQSDPNLSFEQAAARRDFTINAIGYDLTTNTLLDPHGGVDDLRRGRLRHVSPSFDEDPLRVLRACQFAARFSLTIDDDTLARCRALNAELDSLPPERLWEEMKKLLLRAPAPSVGLEALWQTGALSLFPELEALRGCPQEPKWHPEGDVWVHTLMVVDAAARLLRQGPYATEDERERLVVMLGALCHDLGKPSTTEHSNGAIRSPGHDVAGEEPTRALLGRLSAPHGVVDDVVALVREHLRPHQLYASRPVSPGALRRLALRVSIQQLVRVAHADFLGRTTKEALSGDDVACRWLLSECERIAIAEAAPKPLLKGRHLLALGFQPGPDLGIMLKRAFEAQLDGQFDDVEGGVAWAQANLTGPQEPVR